MYLYKNYGISYDINIMKDDNKSILKEALTDYNEIMEAADANAKKKLAEEFPIKFNNLLKEEMDKNKSKKESYKKLDDDEESNKESVMKNKEKETKKVEETDSKPFVKAAKKVEKVEEDVKITDTVGPSDPYKEKAKKVQKVEETLGKSKPFGEKTKKIQEEEEFDITELGIDEVESAFNNADGDDEFNLVDDNGVQEMHQAGQKTFGSDSQINRLHNQGPTDQLIDEFEEEETDVLSLQEIENEIAQMEGLENDLSPVGGESNSKPEMALEQLKKMRGELDEMISSLGGVQEMHQAGQKTFGNDSQINRLHNQGPTDQLIDEFEEEPIEDEEISDEEIMEILGGSNGFNSEEESPVDEAMGISYSDGSITPGKLGNHEGTHGRFRQNQNESKKRIAGLISENKNLTKKLNETKKYKTSVSTLLEQYKTALEKYRNQLKEMAVFNTNLAHVNNLLVNESLALTQDDKIKIINEFKKINTIVDSQKKYKSFINEMKISRKTITESVEEKVITSIQPSSKQKLDEVTAYANDSHIRKMKNIIEYVEKRGKKIIN